MSKRSEATAPPIEEPIDGGEAIDVPRLSTDAPVDPIPVLTPDVEEGEPKKRRRRRKKEEPAPVVEGAMSDEEFEGIVGALEFSFDMALNIVAAKRGPHWRSKVHVVGNGEESREVTSARLMAELWGKACRPWIPALAAKASPFVMAAGMTWFMVVKPGLEEDARLEAEREARVSPTQPEAAHA